MSVFLYWLTSKLVEMILFNLEKKGCPVNNNQFWNLQFDIELVVITPLKYIQFQPIDLYFDYFYNLRSFVRDDNMFGNWNLTYKFNFIFIFIIGTNVLKNKITLKTTNENHSQRRTKAYKKWLCILIKYCIDAVPGLLTAWRYWLAS